VTGFPAIRIAVTLLATALIGGGCGDSRAENALGTDSAADVERFREWLSDHTEVTQLAEQLRTAAVNENMRAVRRHADRLSDEVNEMANELPEFEDAEFRTTLDDYVVGLQGVADAWQRLLLLTDSEQAGEFIPAAEFNRSVRELQQAYRASQRQDRELAGRILDAVPEDRRDEAEAILRKEMSKYAP
jgi:hypothetical protein